MVLLHGLLGEVDHWLPVLDTLRARYRAIAPTLPLFHPSFRSTSVRSLVEFLIRLFDRLGIDSAVVGGDSLGGHLALQTALSHPERVSGVVIAGSSGLSERGAARFAPHRPTTAYVRGRMEQIFYDPAMVTAPWVEAVRTRLLNREVALRFVRFARATRSETLEQGLGGVCAPTLILWGREDRVTPMHVARRFHSGIQGSRLVVLDRCGHAPMIERPVEFASTLYTWLNETRHARSRRRTACA